MKRTYIIILLLITAAYGYGQNSNIAAYWNMVQHYEKNGDYPATAYMYGEILNRQPIQSISFYYHYAQLCHKINKYDQAATYYEKVCHSDSILYMPQAWFELAMAQKSLSQYDRAQYSLQQYMTLAGNHNELYLRCKQELAFMERMHTHMQDSAWINVEKASEKINSIYSEYGTLQDDEYGIYFSSLRPKSQSEYNEILDDYYISQIYMAPYSSRGLGEVYPISPVINNEKYHTGNFCFDKEKKRLYFSRKKVSDGTQGKWSIWTSHIDDEGAWSKPEKLNAAVNAENSSNSSPCLVEGEDYDVLYFVSDRSGGYGGDDIWYTTIVQNQYAPAVNAGPVINTAGMEGSPYYHVKEHRMYFHSDYHPGYGGNDIFYAEGEYAAWNTPVNMGYPINSPANESHFTFNEDDSSGYFTSNRKGSYYVSEENCCNDIYCFEIKPDTLIQHYDTLWCMASHIISDTIQHLLPVTLYFHNDEPDAKTTATTTTQDYLSTLTRYKALRRLYQDEYSKGLKDKEKAGAIDDINYFFASKVDHGMMLLHQIRQWLLVDLQCGNDVTITVKGYASPLFSDNYNTNLSLRRICSFKNYLKLQPEIAPFMDSTTTGNHLYFIEEPKGKSMADKYVSDNPNDKRNSVYSIAAAMERRIQITQYTSTPHHTTQNQAILLPAVNNIVMKKIKNTDIYNYYVELKNIGNKELTIDSVTCTINGLTIEAEKNIINENENTFLHVICTSNTMNARPSGKIMLFSGNRSTEISVSIISE